MRHSVYALLALAATGWTQDIRPLLEKRCFPCHSGAVKQGGLDLSSREGLLKGSEHGPVFVPGNAAASLLFQLVAHQKTPTMPYKGPKIPDEEIRRIAAWINADAPYDEVKAEGPRLEHWAFQPPRRPAVPAVKSRASARNPIDAFLAAERERRGLTPVPPAGPRVLLRRLYLDLIGLPPTPVEMQAFLQDRAPDAYERVVDKLLSDQRYGERWGRHWMDIWRYSDWYGWRKQNQVRYSQRHIWRWRDWIIESLNEDKGYDRMILEMLAGDEVAPADPKIVRATGYLGRNWYMFNRNIWLQDTLEYTATGFLGLTIKCARCHSHKYDPVTHEDYYRFRAFFEPYDVRADRVPGEPDLMKEGVARVYDSELTAQTYRFIRGNEANPDKSKPLAPAVPEFLRQGELKIESVELPLEAYYPDFRPFVQADLLAQAKAEIEKAETRLAKLRQELAQSASNSPPPTGNRPAPAESDAKKQTEVLLAEKEAASAKAALPALEARIAADKANFGKLPEVEQLAAAALKAERHAARLKAEENLLRAQQRLSEAPAGGADEKAAEKKLAEARAQLQAAADALKVSESYTTVGKVYPSTSTGRRLALARWIAGRGNPLTARVAVNHIWMRHFGEPLVPTPSNLGMAGKPPSHPELLDWLAVEFMEKGWSMKALHRLMVTSHAYRMQSSPPVEHAGAKVDPENRYLWRMNARRMEAEAVRDSVLYLTGQLDSTMGGAELDENSALESGRRSIYFRHTPEAQVTFLKIFDAASPNECYERNESVVPHQALALANSKLALAQARLLQKQITARVGDTAAADPAFIGEAFERVLGRPPSPAERAESERFLREQDALFQDRARLTPVKTGEAAKVKPAEEPHLRARENLVHVLFNHNEFVTIR